MEKLRGRKTSSSVLSATEPNLPELVETHHDPRQELPTEISIEDDRLKELERLLPQSAEDKLEVAKNIIAEAGALVPNISVELFFADAGRFADLRSQIQVVLTKAEAALAVVLAKANSDYARIPFLRRWVFYLLALFGRINEATIVSLMSREAKRAAVHAATEELRKLIAHLRDSVVSVEASARKRKEDSARMAVQDALVNNEQYHELIRQSAEMQADINSLDAIDADTQWAVVERLHAKWLAQDAPLWCERWDVSASLRNFLAAQLKDVKRDIADIVELATAKIGKIAGSDDSLS